MWRQSIGGAVHLPWKREFPAGWRVFSDSAMMVTEDEWGQVRRIEASGSLAFWMGEGDFYGSE